jgi:putative nucleotidyltransferase with HDIG domain
MVGNLAAAAAEAIGADSMLARVAAYYHDLGKMMRASFFIENQSGENVHERLKPSLSAIIVNSHVRDGARIADEEKLPPVIRDIIVQHHGTSLMKYFYHRATNGDCRPQDSALEQQFRYPGPKPQTKEAAILMLADVVEAASHMLQKPTPGQIDEFVARMIDEKISDGQLQECPLTLRDLHTIRSVFARQLVGMLHSRVAYPHQENNAGSAFGEIGDLQVDESGVAAEDFGDDRGTGSLFDIDVVDVSSAVEERLKTDRTPL